MMGRGNRLTCRECGSAKPGNYFISPTLCKKCASKRRTTIHNPLIRSVEGFLVTSLALKRLRKRADSEVPKSFRYLIAGPLMAGLSIGGFWIVFSQVVPIAKEMSWGGSLGLAALCAMPIFVGAVLMEWLQAPRKREVAGRVEFLIRERQAAISEAERFYASPEWSALRLVVIKAQGNVCKVCECTIRRSADLTVDHIKPRSKFPALALEISNLRVLCRPCNSKKGDRLFE